MATKRKVATLDLNNLTKEDIQLVELLKRKRVLNEQRKELNKAVTKVDDEFYKISDKIDNLNGADDYDDNW